VVQATEARSADNSRLQALQGVKAALSGVQASRPPAWMRPRATIRPTTIP
jgi:hypothetical protein